MPEPDDLRALRERLEEAKRQAEPRRDEAPPTPMGIATRFATEMLVAVLFGAGLGWVLDRFLHTRPLFLVVLVVLGAAAGIRNVMRAAAELNAKAEASSRKDREH
jgi:ATP synthase protein I